MMNWLPLACIGLISLTACEIDFGPNLPNALPCDPSAPGGASVDVGVSYDPTEMLCIGISMAPSDYDELRIQSRLGGTSDIDMMENVLGWIYAGCSE
ncbi:uncharacterized protein METZ01_LOCUS441662, partial [marine metagenome]